MRTIITTLPFEDPDGRADQADQRQHQQCRRLQFSLDYNYLLSSIAGDNSVIVFDVDKKTGLLKKNFLLPISGEYPKDAEFFPDNKFLVSLNHESNTMTFFHIDLEHGTMIMNGPAMKVNMPNCILFHKLG